MIIKTHKIILIFNTKTFLHKKSIFVDLLTTQNSEMRFFPSFNDRLYKQSAISFISMEKASLLIPTILL